METLIESLQSNSALDDTCRINFWIDHASQ